MAIQKIEIRPEGVNDYGDVVYPKTSADMVVGLSDAIQIFIPSGLISMWSGLISAIPNGWALCNGQNGTPNLVDRFIMGAGTDATINKTGGANTVTLTVEQMPSHKHTGNTNSTGEHTHSVGVGIPGQGTPIAIMQDKYKNASTHSSSSAGAHSHTVTISDTGSGQAHENRPAYFTLAFIMKL